MIELSECHILHSTLPSCNRIIVKLIIVEVVRMRFSTSTSDAMFLSWERVDGPLQVGGEVLPQKEEFSHLSLLHSCEFMGD